MIGRPVGRRPCVRCLGALAATVAALLAAGGAASARVLRATSILPPGESGYVSIQGLLNGTGSPHLYDQQKPYIQFRRKDAMLGQRGVSVQRPRSGVRIVRDAYGVPAIYGATSYDLWWGAGWATAQDRLFELELFRAIGRGTLATLLGPSELSVDIADRRDFYTQAQLARMLAQLPGWMRRRYRAYADGINSYIDYLRRHPSLLPGEFFALGITPTPFSVEDLASIGIYLARTTPNGDGSELTNMQAIQESGPAALDRILPLRIKGSPVTVPPAYGAFPSDPGLTARLARRALRRSWAFVRHLPVPAACNQGWQYVKGTLPPGADTCTGESAPAGSPQARVGSPRLRFGGSYMVAVNDPARHYAVLFNGPELGYQAPEELYEMELHGPGIDVRGVTAPGIPVIAIGHNEHVAFGLTSGLSETNSLYVERLVPGHPDEYYYRGRARRISCRDETFAYHTPAVPLLGSAGGPASSGSVTLRLCATNEGPVQERVGGYVYSRRYATWGRELQTIVALARVDQARSVRQVAAALAGATWDENLMAADDRGNIGYWHPGLLPLLPLGWDQRLPLPGDGRAQWRGFLPVAARPHVIDPRQHWLANWNTLASSGWLIGNDPASEVEAGPFFRGAFLDRLARALARHPSFAGMDALIRRAGTTAQQRPLDAGRLRAALRGARGGAAVLLRTILAWGGSYARENAQGTVAPGVAAWQAFKAAAQALAIRPLGGAGQLIGSGGPNSEHLFDVSLGQAYALRTLDSAGYREAAAAAYAALVRRFHSARPSAWREPRTFAPESALGAEHPPPMPFFDRGTFEEVTALGP
jgi:penicillin amidase